MSVVHTHDQGSFLIKRDASCAEACPLLPKTLPPCWPAGPLLGILSITCRLYLHRQKNCPRVLPSKVGRAEFLGRPVRRKNSKATGRAQRCCPQKEQTEFRRYCLSRSLTSLVSLDSFLTFIIFGRPFTLITRVDPLPDHKASCYADSPAPVPTEYQPKQMGSLAYACSSVQGMRPSQQDTHIALRPLYLSAEGPVNIFGVSCPARDSLEHHARVCECLCVCARA